MVGYFAWNEEAAGSSPDLLYKMGCHVPKAGEEHLAVLLEGFDSITVPKKLLSGAMVSTSVFDTDDIGSSPVSTTNARK